MESNWIKIYEIEYTSDDLSKIYNDNKKYTEEMNLEELVKDSVFVKTLIENHIPYKCNWKEKQLEDIENEKEEEKVVYEPIEKAKKVYMLIVKLIFLIAAFAVIYSIINSN